MLLTGPASSFRLVASGAPFCLQPNGFPHRGPVSGSPLSSGHCGQEQGPLPRNLSTSTGCSLPDAGSPMSLPPELAMSALPGLGAPRGQGL